MKNVHLLPTDKPSRLYNNNGQLHLDSVSTTSNGHTINQNIYITNDEEIKFDDYYLGEDNNLYCLVSKVNSNGKKIILTTDQELIDEGIQPIDDEFLEWFVKNPNCEEVFLTYEYVQVNQGNPILRGSTNVSHRYEIIIPQEEPKQETLSTKLHIGEVVDESYPEAFRKQETLEEPKQETLSTKLHIGEVVDESYPEAFRKQETLEEAAILNCQSITHPYCDREKLMFIKGAKWQEERMYNEEEVLEIIRQYALEEHLITSSKPDIWFEQFKKK
jgi:hypothetical protein